MTTQQKSFFAEPQIEVDPQVVPNPGTPSKIILSEPIKVDLFVYRGDSGSFRITVKDVNSMPLDVSAATWDADIRQKASDTILITNFDIVPVSGDTSSVDVVLSPENSDLLITGSVYDVEMRLGGQVTTLVYGTITLTQDVSRPT